MVQVRIATERNLNFSFNGELHKGACLYALTNTIRSQDVSCAVGDFA